MIKLPINIQPPIITYLHHAYPLSIVMADDSYLPWFRSNFIQLYAHTDYPKKRNTAFNFFTKYHFMDSAKGIAPLGTMALESSLISQNYQGGVMQYVKDNLQLGHFVIAWIDEFYVSRSSFYQIQHQFHELLFYGFSEEEGVFYTLGFDNLWRYTSFATPFSELTSLDASPPNAYMEYIHVIDRRDPQTYRYDFDFNLVKRSLHEYLHSIDSSIRYSELSNPYPSAVYGLDVYRVLDEYVVNLLNNETTHDIRGFQLILEHKQCMKNRFKYMREHGYVEDPAFEQGYEELEAKALKMRNLAIKSSMTQQELPLSKIRQLIEQLHDEESALLKHFFTTESYS